MTARFPVVAAVAVAALFLAAAVRADGDAGRGQGKVEQCAACHGPAGNSGTALTPSLAGQPAMFVSMQLLMFREGVRRVPAMAEIARRLSDADIDDIAAFYAAQKATPRQAGPGRGDLLRQGAELAQAMHCGQCHGRDYRGQNQMPRLAGQREDYLLHAMRQYQSDARTGFDTSMNGVLYGVGAGDLEALAHFLARQQ